MTGGSSCRKSGSIVSTPSHTGEGKGWGLILKCRSISPLAHAAPPFNGGAPGAESAESAAISGVRHTARTRASRCAGQLNEARRQTPVTMPWM